MSVRPSLSLREQYGPKSAAWTEGNFPRIVRFSMNYNPRAQTLLIHWSLGSILVTGPKAEAFFECFCEHKVAFVKAHGKDIMRVTLTLREGKEEE